MNTKPGKYKLEDLIDIEHFQNLQDRLNKIYPFASAVIDNDGNILTATAWQEICANFHRKNRECEKACIQSVKYITEHLEEANPAVTCTCPHGLVDSAIPIIIDGIHYGNFFTGQFFLEEPDMDIFREQAKKYNFPEEKYLEAAKKVPICSQDQLNSYLTFFKGLIDIVSEIGFKNLNEIEARNRIQESEENYRQLFEKMRDACVTIDLKGNIIDANNAFSEMMGYSLDELRALTYEDSTPEKWRNIERDIFEKQVLYRGYSDIYEKEAIHKNGTVFPVELNTFLLKDKAGNAKGICAIGRDISQRKKFEESLKKNEEKHRSILQTAIDGFMMIDKHGDVVEVNEAYCKMSGYTRQELLKMNAGELEAAEPSDEMTEKIDEIVEKQTLRFVRQHKRKDGSLFDVEISSQYQPEDQSFVCFIRDITEKKEMESQLQQAKKMESIGTLAGGIAHDFNNILSPIMMHSELAMEDLPPDDPLQHCMKEIFISGERARDLVKQILTFARKGSEKRIPIQSSLVVMEAVKFLRSTIPTTINIQYSLKPKRDTVLADATQLNQIIVNLCTNAAYAMRETGGVLEIILDNEEISPRNANRFFNLKPGNYLKLSVRDSGTGISPDTLSRIFEPYFTTKKVGEGTGLGLATVHGIVQNYEGDITVESAVGKGTTFHVYLPLVEDDLPGDTEKKVEIQKGTESILIVDDEKAALEISQKMLERLGYKVTATSNGKEALEIFRTNPTSFDLVITDMTMPNMTGDVLSKEIKAITPEIPVILCTGFSDNINEEKAKDIGISYFLLKPIVMSKLAKTIREVLDKKQTETV